MVLKAAQLKLASAEVPIKFYKDREGRLSHHLRVGWRSPWLAGWVNLKVMLVYAADSFLLKAGAVLLVIGLVLYLGLEAGPVRIGIIVFRLYWRLLGVTCATLGYSSIQIGVLARVMHGLKPRFVERLQNIMTYDRGMIASAGLSVAGLVLLGNLTYHYLKRGLQLEAISHPAILGLLLVILGFQTFGFTLLMEVAKLESESVDVVMLISVLEHLAEPQFVIQSAWRLLRHSGLLLVNVPTWSGKQFLELSAFRFGFSPKLEIDDHKMYYGKRDLWPMLVRAGFKPSQIRLRYHKFGLNLFAAATKNEGDRHN